jgi:hypothetical protein
LTVFATVCRMVTVGELVDGADLSNTSKPTVKRALRELGYPEDEEAGDAFWKLTEKQLQDAGLNVREANAVLAKISPATGMCWFTHRTSWCGSQ